jgi:hypothetical protein
MNIAISIDLNMKNIYTTDIKNACCNSKVGRVHPVIGHESPWGE